MAVACDSSTLAAAAGCFACHAPHQQRAIKVRILCAILNGEAMTCDADSLAAAAAELMGLSEQQLAAIEAYLLCQISATIGGGGSLVIFSTNNANPSDSTIYYPNWITGINTTYANAALAIPKDGIITGFNGILFSSTPGSAELIPVSLRLNDTTDFGTVNATMDAAYTRVSSATEQEVSAGDLIAVKMSFPNMATNPSLSRFLFHIFFK